MSISLRVPCIQPLKVLGVVSKYRSGLRLPAKKLESEKCQQPLAAPPGNAKLKIAADANDRFYTDYRLRKLNCAAALSHNQSVVEVASCKSLLTY